MAITVEILVRAKNIYNNPILDIGDIVLVHPVPAKWGTKQCLPDYIIIRMSVVGLKNFMETTKVWEIPPIYTKEAVLLVEGSIIKRRKYKFPEAFVLKAVKAKQQLVIIQDEVERVQLTESIINKANL